MVAKFTPDTLLTLESSPHTASSFIHDKYHRGELPYLMYKSSHIEDGGDVSSILSEISRKLGLEPTRLIQWSSSNIDSLFVSEDMWMSINISGKNEEFTLSMEFASKSLEESKRVAKEIIDLFSQFTPSGEDEVIVNFWNMSLQGYPHIKSRKISVPTWDEISGNYPAKVLADMNQLIVGGRNFVGSGGKLVIFNGKPGTGKTYVIRALLNEWKTWCNGMYITDPDKFLNDASYLMSVILNDNDMPSPYLTGEDDGDVVLDKDKYKLVILEDSGELIAHDAKAQTGQALSKLLNVTEGLIGQGLKLIILITTNEENSNLNEAITRSGRCLMKTTFTTLSTEESRYWLEKNNLDSSGIRASKTLADLYAIKNGHVLPKEEPVFGLIGR